MPKKPPRDKAGFHTSTKPRSAASLLANMLQRNELAPAGAPNPMESTQLRDTLRAALPAELAPRLLATRLTDKELVLFTQSAAWAGRLRLAMAALLGSDEPPAGLATDTRIVVRLMPEGGFRR